MSRLLDFLLYGTGMTTLQWVILIAVTFAVTTLLRVPTFRARMAKERKRNFYGEHR